MQENRFIRHKTGKTYPVDFTEAGITQDGYQKIITESLKAHKMASGEFVTLFITFEVEKESDRAIKLGEKENVTEISNYSIFAHEDLNKIRGKIDVDSAAGNVVPSNKSTYEDDSDAAPTINIYLSKYARKIEGFTWDDKRTKTLSTGQIVGDGIYQEGETKLDGVTVQLVELVDYVDSSGNKTKLEYIWGEMKSGANQFEYVDHEGIVKTGNINNTKGGWYFDKYIPGDYIVRFFYGDNEETILNGENGGLNKESYNGHDYKSTAYKAVINDRGYYDLGNNSKDTSKAKDDEARRLEVNRYSQIINNENGTKLHKIRNLTKDDKDYSELTQKTFMYSETAIIICDIEYNTTSIAGNQDYDYYVEAMNLGIEERPKSSLEMQKEVATVKITLANGVVIVNTAENLRSNVSWISQDRTDGYPKKFNLKGAISVYMDEEVMQGAVIEALYKIVIKNDGEIDSVGKDGSLGETYYTGQVSAKDKIVTTRISKIIDYLDPKMSYIFESNTPNWKEVTKKDVKKYIEPELYDGIIDDNILVTEYLKDISLKPGESTEILLLARKVISVEDGEDKLSYDNLAELIEISNDVGRRDYDAVPGNQDPSKTPQEPDSGYSETIKIMVPFGGIRNLYVYYGIFTIIAVVIAVGIVIIKKKVLVNN